MPDREKVIKGLEAHEKGCGHRSHYCDVMECPYRYWDESCNIEEMCHDALAMLKEQEWIKCSDRMPEERETIFAKLKGTDRWNGAMFEKASDDVRVVQVFSDGSRRVYHDNTVDGKWHCESRSPLLKNVKVTHWMPNPELPKEGR